VQYLPTDVETVHDPGREILQQYDAADALRKALNES
jgi:hypothetical protein